jgi:tetratricopeptide (TPR) repeat protein
MLRRINYTDSQKIGSYYVGEFVRVFRVHVSTLLRSVSLRVLASLSLASCFPRLPVPNVHRAQQFAEMGGQFLEEKELLKAEAAFRLSLEHAMSSIALDGLGCVALQKGLLVDAEKYLLQAIEEDPEYAGAYGNLALLYEREGSFQKAYNYFSMALSLDPGDFRTRNNFAAFLYDSKGEEGFIKDLLLEAMVSSTSAEYTQLIKENLYRLEDRHD